MNDLDRELEEGIELAKSELAAERLAGNVVQASYWRGTLDSYERIKAALAAAEGEK